MVASPSGRLIHSIPNDARLTGFSWRTYAWCNSYLATLLPNCPRGGASLLQVTLFLSVVISYLDRSNLSIVAPKLSAYLHLSPTGTGFMWGAFGWTYAAFQVPTSWLADRVQSRILYCASIFIKETPLPLHNGLGCATMQPSE